MQAADPGRWRPYAMGPVTITENPRCHPVKSLELQCSKSLWFIPKETPLSLKTSSDKELASWDGGVCQAQKRP